MTYPQPSVPIAPKASGLAAAALIVGIAAFVFGLVPFLGILIAITGIVIGAIALSKPGPKTLPVIGLVLSALAAIANIIAIVVVFTLVPTAWNSDSNGADDYSVEEDTEEEEDGDESGGSSLELQSIENACFSFDGPAEFINNQNSDDDESCRTTLQGWGEMDDDGTVTYTGVGAIWDQVLVEPVRVSSSDEWVPDGELSTFVDYLEANYYPQLGEIISLTEPMTLDGQEANLTRFDSDSETTVTKAALVVKAPESYATLNGDVQFFLITFVVVDERGEQIIDALVDSWTWN